MTPMTDPQETASTEGSIRDKMPEITRPVHVTVPNPAARSQQTLADAPPITPQRRSSHRASKWRKRGILLALAISAGATAAVYRDSIAAQYRAYLAPKTSLTLANIQTYTVKRGELRITIVEEGKLRAVNTYPIRMGIEGKILWLAEAGSTVKKGDKLAVMDTKNYEDNKKTYENNFNTNMQQLENAEAMVPIAEADGNAAVSNAKNLLATAELALKQYRTIDVPKKLNDLETAANEAQVKLADQMKIRADLQREIDEFLTDNEEKAAKLTKLANEKRTEASLRRTVNTAEDARKLFRTHTYKQDLGAKERAVTNAKLDVQKAEVQAKNSLAARKADVNRIKTSVEQMRAQIKRYDDMIAKGTAYSPVDGMVFYGGPELQRAGLSPDQIKVGGDWYSNYPIMSIPDLSSFLVDVPIPEVYRGRVKTNMPAIVQVDAIPGLVLSGRLSSVSGSSRPKFQSDSTSPPVYDAVIAMEAADPRMVVGMTARVEIATATLSDVMYVPVEAIFNEEGKTAAFVWVPGESDGEGHLEKRPVYTGQSNDHFVEIKKGLNEADRVALSRPASFVTPTNYREMVDAIIPMSTTAPTSRPTATTRPAGAPANPVIGDDRSLPSTRPTAARGQPTTGRSQPTTARSDAAAADPGVPSGVGLPGPIRVRRPDGTEIMILPN